MSIKPQVPSSVILPVIVFAQLAGTSLWFAGNAVVKELSFDLLLPDSAIGVLTSAVQLGFIAGTLIFAVLTIADRFSPSKVFFVCALTGAMANSSVVLVSDTGYGVVLMSRFLTGFCLAGIYPVGMKIAADHFPKGLGKALGFLLGALALGTASPHLVRALLQDLPWRYVLIVTSCFAVLGGLIILLFVPDGAHRKGSQKVDLSAFFKVFRERKFRAAAFGYFGHMWELYAFWTFVPVALAYYFASIGVEASSSYQTFAIIGVGALSCVYGGYQAVKYGSARVAYVALFGSGLFCLISPLLYSAPPWLFMTALLIWGALVIADSPQFSALVAGTAPAESTGTALTIVNCVGFAITIVSIQMLTWLGSFVPTPYLLLFLTIGPIFGLVSLRKLL